MSDFDPTDFVDKDFQAHKAPRAAAPSGTSVSSRAPTREEVDTKVVEAQQKLAELKRAQEELERERAALEETRRRQAEFETGRQELIQNLTRGLGLLEEAEFSARRDAEQTAKTLADFRDSLSKIQAIQEDTWTKDTFEVGLTRALTALENARMEWNSARLKYPVLSGQAGAEPGGRSGSPAEPERLLGNRRFGEWCKLGLALTWPVALAVLLSAAAWALLAVVFRR
jgi:hypothetical protein